MIAAVVLVAGGFIVRDRLRIRPVPDANDAGAR